MAEKTSISIKSVLRGLDTVRDYVDALYRKVKEILGEEAEFVHDLSDFQRVAKEEPESFEGSYLSPEIIKGVWQLESDYLWHYHDEQFLITPSFMNGDNGILVIFPNRSRTLITFAEVMDDVTNYDAGIWDALEARIVGNCDGYISSLKRERMVLADMPAPDATVAPDLKWKDGYGVDPAEAVKVPDGTLACADPAEPESLDQTEPAPAESEKPADRIIRAGGPSPQRYG